MERYDVVVVGGGPAGAVAARAAAQRGARVLVLERSPHRPPRCTGLVGPRVLDLLSVPMELVLGEVRAVRVHAPGGQVAEFCAPAPRGYVLDRLALDHWLLEGAGEAGAEVRAPVAALGVSGRVLHTTAGPVEFGVLIGADGAMSSVRRWGGLPPPGELVVGAQATVVATGLNREGVEIHLGQAIAPGGFAWVVPAGDGEARVGLLTSKRRDAQELLARFLDRRCPGWWVLRRETGLVPIGPPAHTVGNGVVLVGDAAGQVKPLTGGGLLFGTLSARIVGEVAACGPENLASYEARWRAAAGEEIAVGLRARAAFVALSDNHLNRIVAFLRRPSVRRLVAEEGDIDQPSRLVRSFLTHPRVWKDALPLVRLLGGWGGVRRLAHGLPAKAEPV